MDSSAPVLLQLFMAVVVTDLLMWKGSLEAIASYHPAGSSGLAAQDKDL